MSNIADGPLTSVALCWELERCDGAGIALTSHDRSVEKDGVTYLPSPGAVPAAVTRRLGLEPHSGELAGSLSHEALAPADLALGRWSGATVSLSAVDWRDPELPPIELIRGELGEVSIKDESFSAELLGAAAKLDRPVCPRTSPECRAEFGGARCRVDLAGRTTRAAVVSAVGAELTLDRTFDDRVVLGRLRYLGGGNCGLSTVVLAVQGNVVRVRDLPRAAVAAGCAVELREGCDKRFETCVTRFDNAVNFRGEPHLPGTDLLTRYPGA